MGPSEQTLDRAREHFLAGRLEQAAELCQPLLAEGAANAEALHLAGLIAHRRGAADEAADLLQRAIAADGRQAQFHYNLGIVYHAQGRRDLAVEAYRRALAIEPRSAGVHNNLGFVLYELGQLDEAIGYLEQSLRLDESQAEAHNNLGLALAQRGETERSALSYRRALRLKPDLAEAHFNLGLALNALGRNYEAVDCYRRVLELRPEHSDAQPRLASLLAQLGSGDAIEALERAISVAPGNASLVDELAKAYGRAGRLEEALEWYQTAVQIQPDSVVYQNNLGHGLRLLGRFEEALEAFQHAARLSTGLAEPYANLGRTYVELRRFDEATQAFEQALVFDPKHAGAHSGLGNVLKEQGRLDDAVEKLHASLALNPSDVSTHVLLGNTYTELKQFAEAEAAYRAAALLEPADAVVRSNIGHILILRGKVVEGEAECRLALAFRPDYVEAHHNRSMALAVLGRADEARAERREALRLRPDYVDGRLGRALDLLRQGDFDEGWTEYEWRWKRKDRGRPNLSQPEWDGSPLNGRTILLYAEQGLGDTLQFIRYAPLIQQRGGRVVVNSPKPLLVLLRHVRGIDQLIASGDALPAFDVQLPLLSAPRVLGTRLATVPRDVPYLFADPTLVEQWGRELASLDGFKIAIAWQGNPDFIGDPLRSIALRHFERLARVPGVRLLSLQKGSGREQLSEIAGKFAVVDLADRLDVSSGAFMDTAAVIKSVDLVVTSDSAIAHLAGALGAPTWLVVQLAPDWRWMDERDDSPWYPTMRLFRQRSFNDWDEVFQRIATAAECEAAAHRPASAAAPQHPQRVPRINLSCAISSIGYGVVGLNVLKSLNKTGASVACWPAGAFQPPADDAERVRAAIERQANHRDTDPSLRIFHQCRLKEHFGKPRIGFPIFELDRFTAEEMEHLRSQDLLLVTSHWARQVVEQNEVYDGCDRVRVVPLGVDRAIFHEAQAGEEQHAARGTTIFLAVGKWERRKGYDVLLEAFTKAFTPDDDVELRMLTFNPVITSTAEHAAAVNAEWETLYRNSPLGAKIRLLPRLATQHEVAAAMRQADCGVFLSRAEGWNLPALEMLSCGKHIIITDYSAHTEYCDATNARLIEIDTLEDAHDGRWFAGQGRWASLGPRQLEQAVEHLRQIHALKQQGRLAVNHPGIDTARRFKWDACAARILEAIGEAAQN